MSVVQYLKYEDIDKAKWDNCIAKAENGLIYAQSVYLDRMCENWDGLVLNDYEWVMPLTFKRKMGFSYLYQPFFMQQGGVFGPHSGNKEVIAKFLKKAEERFRKIHIHLNYGNTGFGIERCNLVLDLNRSFADISRNFRKDLTVKAVKADAVYKESLDFELVISLYRRNYGAKTPEIKDKHYRNFLQLCTRLCQGGMAKVREVKSATGELLSAAIFFYDSRRIYYIMSALDSKGREIDATAFLLYRAIEEHAGSNLIFDFEGSQIPSVRFFFKKFSPVTQPYFLLKKGWF